MFGTFGGLGAPDRRPAPHAVPAERRRLLLRRRRPDGDPPARRPARRRRHAAARVALRAGRRDGTHRGDHLAAARGDRRRGRGGRRPRPRLLAGHPRAGDPSGRRAGRAARHPSGPGRCGPARHDVAGLVRDAGPRRRAAGTPPPGRRCSGPGRPSRRPRPRSAGCSPSRSSLVLGGIAFKLSLVPFHAWTPTTYAGSPTSRSRCSWPGSPRSRPSPRSWWSSRRSPSSVGPRWSPWPSSPSPA